MTKDYNLLLSISLRHAYYSNSSAAGLSLEPLGRTAALLRRNDAHVRMDGDRLIVFYGTEAGKRPFLAYLPGKQSLYFSLISKDPYFFNITEIPFFHPQSQRLYASNIGKTAGTDGFTRLSVGENVDGRDVLDHDKPVFKELNLPANILGLVEIVIGREPGLLPLPSADPAALPPEEVRFSLDFEARKVNWRYLIVNKSQLNFEQMEVLDGRNLLEFQQGEPRLLRGTNYMAVPIASVDSYAIQEQSAFRPKLRLSPAGGNGLNRNAYTLVDLPVPDGHRVVPEMVNGAQQVFADMYVFL